MHGPVVCLVGRARDLLDDVASTCVCVCRVCMICAFCISAALLRTVFSCIVIVYALWCSRRMNLTAEIALASPHPPVATLLAHTCTQVHRPTQPNQADAYTHWVGQEGDTEGRDEEKRREV